MAAMTLDDGGWGAIASNFANALNTEPTKRAQIYVQGAQYQKLLLEAEEQKRKMAAVEAAVRGFPSTLPPEVTLPPIDGQAQFGPPLPAAQQAYKTNREQIIRDNAAASYLARDASDYAKGVFPTRALSEVSGGIPSSPARQDVLQTMISPSGGSLPNYSTTPHTYQPMAGGEPVGDPITSRRMPDVPSTLLTPGKLGEVNNPFESDAKMVNTLAGMQKRLSAGGEISKGEAEQAGIMMDRLFPLETEMKDVNGRLTPVTVRKKAIDAGFGHLAEIADGYRRNFAPGAPRANWGAEEPAVPYMGAGAGGALTAPSMPPPAAPPVGGLAGVPAPHVAAAPPAPIVPPPDAGIRLSGGPQGTVGAPITSIDPTKLAKEATGNKLTYEYETVQQNWESLVQNMKIDSKAADIGIIFAAAKTLDPPSVVRGPEGEMLAATGGVGDRLLGLLNAVQGGGRLTADQRADLALAVQNRAKATENVYFQQRKQWEQQGIQGGLTREQIDAHLPSARPLTPFNIKDVNKYLGVQSGGGRAAYEKKYGTGAPEGTTTSVGAPTTSSTAPARGRTIRVNPQTGAIEEVR